MKYKITFILTLKDRHEETLNWINKNIYKEFFYLVLDGSLKNYNQRIKDNIQTIKKLPKIKGIKEILYPGQNKFNRYKKNYKKEIQIPKNIIKDLDSLMSKF